jgi:putative phosphotransacetylase
MQDNEFLVEVSARHVHLCKADVEALFGPGKTLTFKRPLSQPGQFLSEERVDIVGPKNTFKNVAILGPERPASQAEVSVTDSYTLGIPTVVRESGYTESTPGFTVVGPCGTVEIKEGLIAAKRHIHMTPEDAEHFGRTNNELVSIRVESPTRSLTFDDVIIRVSENAGLAIHIDTDESNAAGGNAVTAVIVDSCEKEESFALEYDFGLQG